MKIQRDGGPTYLLETCCHPLFRKASMKTGTRVHKYMGVRLDGVIIESFHWEDSNDGTYSPPKKDEVPVRWDDNTQGYISKRYLREI